ncbi:MAG: zinc-dependent peptidase [Sulfurovum sp.]|uniref:M90 family metallopeptidase n=1 Tax=Sulfurovum sp. TaxID=1969726 RepID=UPI002867CD74|nr:zinc-dependent peptidase [Sulfurovum sp.]MCO4844732.1 zinc-dependent peptidase [Sulfurovum sp.]
MNYYLLLIQFLFSLVGLFLLLQGIGYFHRIWQYKKLKSLPFPNSYEEILQNIHQYKVLSPRNKEKLRLLILLFIDNKEFVGAKMTINDEIKVIIAFYACLMRLGFDLGDKDDVSTVIVYPKHFIVNETHSSGGINRSERSVLEGQSANGTVVISWQDIKYDIAQQEKDNVIIHEFAHELDFEDGFADGTPVLEDSNYRRWSEVFSKAFDILREQRDKGKSSDRVVLLGTYALKNEAEFFAVCSERFFETPKIFKAYFPDIYQELQRFYRLDTEVLFKDLSEI